MSDRVGLNLRVPKRDVRAFEEVLVEKYGQTESYAGMELERELRALLDMGDLADLEDAVLCAADTFGGTERKKEAKENSVAGPEVGGETTIVRYAIHETVRGRLEDAAEEYTVQSAGRLVGRVMRYYAEGGTIGFVIDKLRDAVDWATDAAGIASNPDETEGDDQDAEAEGDSEPTPAERMAARLDRGFRLDAFIDAADAEGIGTDTYAVKKFLPRVLDIKDAVPHPHAPEVFVPRDDPIVPEHPNPARLPYQAMTDEDKRTALVAAALENGEGRKHSFMSLADGAAVLHGSPRHSTVRGLYDDIAAQHPGFFARERGDDYQLIANMQDVRRAYKEDGTLEKELHMAGVVGDADGTGTLPDQPDGDVTDTTEDDPAPEADSGTGMIGAYDVDQSAEVGRHLADD